MKTIPNKTADDIIRWLFDLKSRLPPDTIQSREKIRKIDKAIKILGNGKNHRQNQILRGCLQAPRT